MHAETSIVVTMTMFNFHIVTDLEADSITVVIARGYIANGVSIAVLQKNAPPIITIQVGIIFSVAVQRQIFNNDVFRIFTGQERKQRRHRRLA